MSSTQSRTTGIVFAFSCLLLIGMMPVIANDRPHGTSSLGFAFYLSVFQLFFALPLAFRDWRSIKARQQLPITEGSEQNPPILRRHWLILCGSGLLFGISTYFYILAAEKAGAVGSAIAIQAYPLFAILIESVFLGQRKSPAELGFTILMIAAIIYLATGGSFSAANVSYWFVFALSIPFIWSIAHITLREVMTRSALTPGIITCVRVLVSSALLFLLLITTEGARSIAVLARNTDFLFSAALMGFVYYAELVLWFHAARHIDISLASSITAPSPAATMIFAILFLGDQVSSQQIIAFSVILLCLYGLLYAGKRRVAATTRS